jgi:predicted Zn-dependent protease
LARIIAKKGDWVAAAEQQRLALAIKQRLNSSRDYFQLATYYLRCQKNKAAYEAMLTGVAKENPMINSLPKLLAIFQSTRQLAAFPDFYRLLRSKLSFSYTEDIQMAKLLLQRKQYEFAIELLNNVTQERDYLPTPWELLAEIYRRQGKTAKMKAASMKAALRLKQTKENSFNLLASPIPSPQL